MRRDAFFLSLLVVPTSFQASQDHYFIGLKILNNLVAEMNQVRHNYLFSICLGYSFLLILGRILIQTWID